MDKLNMISIMIALFSTLISILVIAMQRKNTKDTLERLTQMLDSAINGSFTERIYNESALAAVETKMSKYLAQCTVSSKNLAVEKDKIKTLISDISHQTKTPIANILLYAQLLAEYELSEDYKVCINALLTQAEKLNFLIDALVKTSRLEVGIISVIPQQNNVDRLLDTVVNQAMPKAKEKHISLIVADNDSQAYFDMKWTAEAVYNIVDNAIKYSKEDTLVKLEVQSYELFCRIDIIDHGIGIDPGEQNKIFTRFYRSQVVNQQEGVGIGLFLSREILLAQGGYIKVQSKIGEGTVFSVFLPKEK